MADLKKTRTRMSPKARIAEILDHCAIIVSTEGVAAVTMERVGKAAGISKSLVYSYFPSTTELLKKLLYRELRELRRKQTIAAENASSFDQMVRAVTREYLQHIDDRGVLIYRLQSEPSVSVGHQGITDYSRETSVKYLAEIVSRVFDIPMSIALPSTDISFGLPDAAGNYLDREKADRQMVEDITVVMIVGCIKALKDNYELSLKPIR